ncbi:glycosaminoglycan attachment site [Comamonas sp. NoAH]|uniref:glycosaminoglycan attachment site n=1 Tax=Comamonas halotolerans TaxID=3041496 RepID=UPI0024E0F12A|nr:glycosaminoglycan attachment site [Comamonas sp. NoAH]
MELFNPIVPRERWHPIFKMLVEGDYAPERAVLTRWAEGFSDRDGKFVQEFQLSFEPCLWELYLNACLVELGHQLDFSHHAPDFVVQGNVSFSLEATIAAPAAGGRPAYGWSIHDLPEDLNQFNLESTLRICNSFSSKVKRYREHYKTLGHVVGKPFVIGIASFDRPLAHFAALRPVIAALYGLYHDEEATPRDATSVVSYNVAQAPKNADVNIDLGLFCDDSFADVSAIIYSSVATWGKVRGVADNSDAKIVFTTLHPQEGSLMPRVLTRLKRDYSEHLLDGLVVLHNPFATHPLPSDVFQHPRVAQIRPAPSGELVTNAPDDFLLLRMLQSFVDQ